MARMVVSTAQCKCSFGNAPAVALISLSAPNILVQGMPAAVITDNKPMVNILPFGMCSSMTNPTVASATAAAGGVLTPMPCIPAIVAPWTPGQPKVLIKGKPALTGTSKCMCNWGGAITITNPGTTKVYC